MFKIVCRVQIKFVISFTFSSVDRGLICMCLWSDNTLTLITHERTLLNKTLFLRTFHDQYRRRQVVDQCSLWKERPLQSKNVTAKCRENLSPPHSICNIYIYTVYECRVLSFEITSHHAYFQLSTRP